MQIWRSTLYPGQSLYYWSVDGDVAGEARLEGPSSVRLPAWTPAGWWRPYYRAQYDCGATVPADTKPGRYWLTIGGVQRGQVAVLQPPKTRTIHEVLPHRWELNGPFLCQPNTTYRGRNTLVVGGEIYPADNTTFEDLIFRPEPGGAVFATPSVPARNVTVSRCRLESGSFGPTSGLPGLLVQHCDFRRASLARITGGMFISNTIEGRSETGDPEFDCWATINPLAVLGLTMRDTSRGLNLRPSVGNIQNALIAGVSLSQIDGYNAGEVLNTEGNPACQFSHNLFFHVYANGCPGPFQFEREAHGNKLCDLSLDGSINFLGDVPQTGNEIYDSQIGGSLYYGPQATDNTAFLSCVHRPPHWQNQHRYDPALYAQRPAVVGAERQKRVRAKVVNWPGDSADVDVQTPEVPA